MWGQYTFLPSNVSFTGCEFQEEKCPSTDPTGFYKIANLTIWHNPNDVSKISEPPDTNSHWVSIQADNTAIVLDKATIIANVLQVDYLETSSFGIASGSGFTWNIPIRYKCNSDTDTGVALPGTVFTIMQVSNEFGSSVIKGTEQGYDSVTNP